MSQHRKRNKDLGLPELIAIALGGMVGGGIFTILGISVSIVGSLTPLTIICGGLIALLAAYSYVKLGLYYLDEGATYSFYKKTYPNSNFSASAIGWFIVFGYISTLSLYAYTFSAYAISGADFADNSWIRKIIAVGIIGVFTLINVWSVNGMGKIEDIMVYAKLTLLTIISFVLIQHGNTDFSVFIDKMILDARESSMLSVLIVASITFVAYEGFQLVINATNEMTNPEKNIPRAVFSAIGLAVLIYVVIAIGALFAIPMEEIINNKEYALAAGSGSVLGPSGANLVIFGAILATSSAISGTIFGSSRQMSIVAQDGYFPRWLSHRKNNMPKKAIATMAIMASVLIVIGELQLILEFGSITFLLVSLLMAIANHKIRHKTNSSILLTLCAILGLGVGGALILYYEFTSQWRQMAAIIALYVALGFGSWLFSKRKATREKEGKRPSAQRAE